MATDVTTKKKNTNINDVHKLSTKSHKYSTSVQIEGKLCFGCGGRWHGGRKLHGRKFMCHGRNHFFQFCKNVSTKKAIILDAETRYNQTSTI